MTAREAMNYALIELNKVEAPSMLLADYVYFFNKAVQQYTNKTYNKFDITQQTTDDLRVLQTSVILDLSLDTSKQASLGILENTYVCELPKDYLHLLNCIVEYTNVSGAKAKCSDDGQDKVFYPARRLTADMYPTLLTNAYLCPMYKRPYYYLHNVNSSEIVQTNPTMDSSIEHSTQKDFSTPLYDRISNVSPVLMEIRYGSDLKFRADRVYVDYIKSPMYIRITDEQLDDLEDTTQVLEFPDYVCFEIINEFVKLIMENASDPRIQTNPPVNQTISEV